MPPISARALSTALLARLWQMLTKGIEETAKSPSPLAAAEMVLIRIAFTADLPPPDEIIKALGGMTGAPKRTDRPAAPSTSDPALARAEADAPPPRAAAASPERPTADAQPQVWKPRSRTSSGSMMGRTASISRRAKAPSSRPPRPCTGRSTPFADVVALAGDRRDAKLKVNLEDHVSLVRFDASNNAIDLFLLPGAPPEIANDLREKLIKWTGRRWVVMLSRTQGEQPIGAARREARGRRACCPEASSGRSVRARGIPGSRDRIREADPRHPQRRQRDWINRAAGRCSCHRFTA